MRLNCYKKLFKILKEVLIFTKIEAYIKYIMLNNGISCEFREVTGTESKIDTEEAIEKADRGCERET